MPRPIGGLRIRIETNMDIDWEDFKTGGNAPDTTYRTGGNFTDDVGV